MQGLTKKQQEIVEFIEKYLSENHYSPSFREIRDHFGFSSLGTVYNHIQVLKRKNVLSDAKGARSLSFTNPLQTALEIPLIGKLSYNKPLTSFAHIRNFSFPISKTNSYLVQIEGQGFAEEHIINNDLLLIEPRQEFKEGEVVIATIEGTANFIRQAFNEFPYIRFESANHELYPLLFRKENVEILGIVLSLFRNFCPLHQHPTQNPLESAHAFRLKSESIRGATR